MPNLNFLNQIPPGGWLPIPPEFGRIPVACQVFGMSRSRLYELAARGLIRIIKDGNKNAVVDFSSVREYYATCPAADIKVPSLVQLGE
jgi:hypothetical protein